MATARKYLFDVSFDQAASQPNDVLVPAPAPEPEEKFSRADLDAAREAARAEGHGAGLAEANDAATAKAAAAIIALATGVTALITAQDLAIAETQRQAIAALRVIVAKTLPVFAAKGALAEIEAFATKSLAEAFDEPRVVLRVANGVYESVRGQLDTMAAASGYGGRIVLLADETLAASDAHIEWADGGVERNLAEQLSEVDAAMARSCDPAATPNPPSTPGDVV
jgi:flagellar assembly protein FliH